MTDDKEYECIKCGHTFDPEYAEELPGLPDCWTVYLCPHCNVGCPWWALYGFHKSDCLLGFARAKYFESLFRGELLDYNQFYQKMQLQLDKSISIDQAWANINAVFRFSQDKGINSMRYPSFRLSGERYTRVEFLKDKMQKYAYLNRRNLKQWDLRYLDTDSLIELRQFILNNKKHIRFWMHWMDTIDIFLNPAE